MLRKPEEMKDRMLVCKRVYSLFARKSHQKWDSRRTDCRFCKGSVSSEARAEFMSSESLKKKQKR